MNNFPRAIHTQPGIRRYISKIFILCNVINDQIFKFQNEGRCLAGGILTKTFQMKWRTIKLPLNCEGRYFEYYRLNKMILRGKKMSCVEVNVKRAALLNTVVDKVIVGHVRD